VVITKVDVFIHKPLLRVKENALEKTVGYAKLSEINSPGGGSSCFSSAIAPGSGDAHTPQMPLVHHPTQHSPQVPPFL